MKRYIEISINNSYRVHIYTVQAKRLQSLVKTKNISFYKKKLSTGIVIPSIRLIILSDRELFNYEFAPAFQSPIEGVK